MTLEEPGFWALCLALAKIGDGVIPAAPEVAWEFRSELSDVDRLLKVLVLMMFLLPLEGGGFTPNDWEQYQEKKSSDRVKKHREAKKLEKTASETNETFHAFHGNVSPVSTETNETPRQDKTETRQRQDSSRGLSLIQPEDRGPRPKPNSDLMAGFEEFIAEYPNKVQVDMAATTWLSLADLGEITPGDIPEIMAGLDRWKISRQWESDGGRFIPAPFRFIRDRLWRDDPPKGESAKAQERFPEWQPPKKNREPEVA
jgi:hypothetical protein